MTLLDCLNCTDITNSSIEDDDYYYHYDYNESVSTLPLVELIPTAIVYGLTLLVGITGNSLVIFSIARYRRMRNITNIFLVSLASADLLLVLICVPVKFAAFFSFTWTLGEFLCKAVVYLQNVSSICSVLTLTVMSIERYYAILHPLKAKYVCTVSRAKKAILLLWLLSLILALPIIFLQIHKLVGVVRTGYWCVKDYEAVVVSQLYEVYMFSLMLVIPVIIMVYAYSSICVELWKVTRQRMNLKNGREACCKTTSSSPFRVHSDTSPVIKLQNKIKISTEDDTTRKQVIKMLVAVIVIFIICWAPILTNNLLTSFEILDPLHYGYLKTMRMTFYLMSYVNSCMNPIIYGFMSKSFRQTFIYAVCTCVRGQAYVRRMYFLHQNSSQTRSTLFVNNSKSNCDIEMSKQLDQTCIYGTCGDV